MSRLPTMKYRDVASRLRHLGFEYLRPGKGSHEVWINRCTRRVTMLPCHPGDIPKGTLRAIIMQAGLSVDDFLR